MKNQNIQKKETKKKQKVNREKKKESLKRFH